MTRIAKFCAILYLLILVIGLFACSLVIGLRTWNAIVIASRFHVKPSWEAIQSHLFYNEFKPGMTREEVHQVLNRVGSWEITWSDPLGRGRWNSDTNQYEFRELIRWTDKGIFWGIDDWGFEYDQNGILVSQGPLDYA